MIAWPPNAYKDLIKREPTLSIEGVTPVSLHIHDHMWTELITVNEEVNYSAAYKEDPPGQDRWGSFSLFQGRKVGDCDDYAVHKLQRLLALGWPRGALLLSVCKTGPDQTPHLVLLVQQENEKPVCMDNRHSGLWLVDSAGTRGYSWIAQEWPGHAFWWQKM